MTAATRQARLPRRSPTAGDLIATMPTDQPLTAADIQVIERDALRLSRHERDALRRYLGPRMASAGDYGYMLHALGYPVPRDPDPPQTIPEIVGLACDGARATGWEPGGSPLPRRHAMGAAVLIGTAPLTPREHEDGLRLLSGMSDIDMPTLRGWAAGPTAPAREVIAI